MSEQMPTYNQIIDQQGRGLKPSVLVRRSKESGGAIEAHTFKGMTADGSGRWLVDVGEGMEKPVHPQRLSDSYQEELAAELAGEPLRNHELIDDVPLTSRLMGGAALTSFGIEQPRATEDEVEAQSYKDLSQSARQEIEALQKLQDLHKGAHNAGDWTSSTTFKQQAFMLQQELSEEARTYLNNVGQRRRRPRG